MECYFTANFNVRIISQNVNDLGSLLGFLKESDLIGNFLIECSPQVMGTKLTEESLAISPKFHT